MKKLYFLLKQKWIALLVVLLIPFYGFSQLRPSIGIPALPSDEDSICPIPFSNPPNGYNFQPQCFQAGEVIPDFTLYTLNNEEFNIKRELEKGKPVLLFSGSFTCNVFRNQMPIMDSLAMLYKDFMTTILVYVVEPHPVGDISPYTKPPGNEWSFVPGQNQYFQARQPRTYGERKKLADSTLERLHIFPQMIIDGPCNEWWINFGKAPNLAVLIKPDGVVFGSNGWFEGYPKNGTNIPDMSKYVDSLYKISNPTGLIKPMTPSGRTVQVFPNPANDYITFSFPNEEARQVQIVIQDITGRVIKVSNISTSSYTANLSGAAPGIYYYHLRSSGNKLNYSGKFIITTE